MAKQAERGAAGGLIAAVDLGSNSFHMVVARPIDGHLRVVDRLRETVQLAAGVEADNRLTDAAQERALACLRRFGQHLRDMPPGSVRIVGTNTLRKARNAADFIAEAERVLHHPVEVIAGREEARLIYLGVSHGLPSAAGRRLVVDIGGGSTEVIVGEGFEPLQRESLYMGCVSFSERYFPAGRVDAQAMRAATLAARVELEPVEASYRRAGWDEAVGASGTIRAVHRIVEQMGWSEDGITRAALVRLGDALVAAGQVDRLELKGLKAERRAVLPGGVALLYALFEALDVRQMQVSDWALREGVLYDLMGRIRHEDVRERSIRAMARRYHVDPDQAQRVEATAQALRAEVGTDWNVADEGAGQLLSWAARLHEIGLAIAHNQHHKHAAYLLEHSDLPGFSRQEQSALALLVRAHRRKFPLALFSALPASSGRRHQRLAILLRLAVALNRSRGDRPPAPVALQAKGNRLVLALPSDWLESHPLTRADLEVESRFLEAAGVALSLE